METSVPPLRLQNREIWRRNDCRRCIFCFCLLLNYLWNAMLFYLPICLSYKILILNVGLIWLFVDFLHGYFLSIRQLKRILQSRDLGRRRNRSKPGLDVYRAIERELRGSASTMGIYTNDSKTLTWPWYVCWQGNS